MNEKDAIAWAVHELSLSELYEWTGISKSTWQRIRRAVPRADCPVQLPTKKKRAAPKKKEESAEPVPPKPSKWTVVPADWQPNEKHAAFAREHRIDLKIEVMKFTSHEFRVPKVDPDRTFTTWLATASQARPPGAPVQAAAVRQEKAPYHRPFDDDAPRARGLGRL